MKTVGAKRVMFGTNWPMLAPSVSLRELDKLGLSEDQQGIYLSGNARRVINL